MISAGLTPCIFLGETYQICLGTFILNISCSMMMVDPNVNVMLSILLNCGVEYVMLSRLETAVSGEDF